jgi:L-rhamnose isomerase/sugar isomerase
MLDAFAADVRPLCAKVRTDLGADPDPIAAFRAGGYAREAAEKRAEGTPAGWS